MLKKNYNSNHNFGFSLDNAWDIADTTDNTAK